MMFVVYLNPAKTGAKRNVRRQGSAMVKDVMLLIVRSKMDSFQIDFIYAKLISSNIILSKRAADVV